MNAGRNFCARAASVIACKESLAFGMEAMTYLAAVLRDVDIGACRDKRLEYVVSDLLFDILELVGRDVCLDRVATKVRLVLLEP